MYKQPSTPFRKVNECARALGSVYTGKMLSFPCRKKKIKYCQCRQKDEVVEGICEIIQKVFFSKLQNQECNGKMEKDKWRQGSKKLTFQSTEV